jgi:hypothetical protein
LQELLFFVFDFLFLCRVSENYIIDFVLIK